MSCILAVDNDLETAKLLAATDVAPPARASCACQQELENGLGSQCAETSTSGNNALQLQSISKTPSKNLFVAFIWNYGAVCMSITAFIFAISAFCVKLMHGRLSVFQIVVTRSSFSAIITILVNRHGGIRQEGIPLVGDCQNWPLLLSRSIFGTAAMTLYYFSIQLLPLGDAVTIFFSNAAVTTMIAVIIGLEKPSLLITLGCAICTGGVILMSQPPLLFGGDAWSTERLAGVLCGLASACCAAGAFLSIRALGNGERAITMSMWFHCMSSLTSALPLLYGVPMRAVWPTMVEWVLLTIVVWTSFIGQLLLSRGFQLLPPSKAAAINLSQVVYAYILSVAFLNDQVNWQNCVGTILTAGGVVLAQFGRAPHGKVGLAIKNSSASLQGLEADQGMHATEMAVRVSSEHQEEEEINIVLDVK